MLTEIAILTETATPISLQGTHDGRSEFVTEWVFI
jgi:hypothetical protein